MMEAIRTVGSVVLFQKIVWVESPPTFGTVETMLVKLFPHRVHGILRTTKRHN